jgi:hypothetical protein
MNAKAPSELHQEFIRLAEEAVEIIDDCRRYLTEFGSVEPDILVRRIDCWRNDLAINRAQREAAND